MASAATAEEAPHFSDPYHAARRGYVVSAGLLLAWGLVGLSVSDADVGDVPIKIASPDAVPYVLVVLVLYFAFRLTTEWLHTDIRRRRLRISQVDFAVSHVIGCAAIGSYLVQRLGGAARIATWIKSPASLLAIGFALGAGLAALSLVRRTRSTVLWSAGAIILFAIALLSVVPAWQILGIAGTAISALLVPVSLQAFSARRSPATVDVCRKIYRLQGPRGQHAEISEELTIRLRRTVNALPISYSWSEGAIEPSAVELFELPGGQRVDSPVQIFGDQILSIAAQLQAGHEYRLVRRHVARDAFPADEEGVGKRVLYPTRLLSFEVQFESEPPTSVAATRQTGGLDTDYTPLAVVLNGNLAVVRWEVFRARPGETCRITWRWPERVIPYPTLVQSEGDSPG